MRKVALSLGMLIVIISAALLGALWLIDRWEKPRSRFATFAEMEAAGMIPAGWLPGFLPQSAREIEETHNIDTNRVVASFKYEVGDISSVEAACRKLAADENHTKYLCRPRGAQSSILVLGKNGIAHYSSSRDLPNQE